MMGEDARGLVHWVPLSRVGGAICGGGRVKPSDQVFPTCLWCVAYWLQYSARGRDHRDHTFNDEVLH